MDGETGPGGSDLSGENSGVSSVDAGYFTDPTAYSGYFGLDPDEASGLASTYSKQELANLSSSGYGTLTGLNKNNPTQSVDEMLAAQNVHNVLNYAVPAFVNLVPGYGTVSALGKGIANIHGLMTGRLTPAEVMPGLAAGLIGAKTGIPSGILEGLFENNPGKAAGAGAQAGLTSLANSMSPLGGLAVGLSGIGPSFGKAVSDAVSGATGGGRSGGLGGLSGSGAGSAPSQGSAPTGNASGDVGISPDTYAVLAAIEQAAQEPAQPAWERQTVAGRYGPIMNYDFGA